MHGDVKGTHGFHISDNYCLQDYNNINFFRILLLLITMEQTSTIVYWSLVKHFQNRQQIISFLLEFYMLHNCRQLNHIIKRYQLSHTETLSLNLSWINSINFRDTTWNHQPTHRRSSHIFFLWDYFLL